MGQVTAETKIRNTCGSSCETANQYTLFKRKVDKLNYNHIKLLNEHLKMKSYKAKENKLKVAP